MSYGYPPNFAPGEFVCKCDKSCRPPAAQMRFTAWVLQRIRDEVACGLRVTSGFRCKSHNSSVGGSQGSDHLKGLAADIVPLAGVDVGYAWQTIRRLRAEQKIPDVRIGRYDTFIHVGLGVRGARDWDYRKNK
jgi:uncharacterized protein YcbK (DUF882 family)|tara:strand:- start:5541 stop:5939 length:399 start_codon:yes stop_codon:yes gene_type:complete